MATFIDQTGRSVNLIQKPKRIISIVPSQSEYLWDIGVREELIGITKFCVHPEVMFKSVQRVGGTKNLNIKKIRELQPDLIIGNKEENERSQIELLQKEFNVWMSDIYNFNDAFVMMSEIGKMTDRNKPSEKIIDLIKKSLHAINGFFNNQKVIYLIWKKPYMLVGNNTFIDFVLNHSGFNNCAKSLNRYPELSEDDLKNMKPDFCFLSSEPYPFKEKHIEEFQKLLPQAKIKIVDGEMFSWYGSRLTKLPEYLKELKKELLSS